MLLFVLILDIFFTLLFFLRKITNRETWSFLGLQPLTCLNFASAKTRMVSCESLLLVPSVKKYLVSESLLQKRLMSFFPAPWSFIGTESFHVMGGQHWPRSVPDVVRGPRLLAGERLPEALCRLHPQLHIRGGEHSLASAMRKVGGYACEPHVSSHW